MVCWFLGGWERLLSNENKVQKRNVELGIEEKEKEVCEGYIYL